jgi:hypothetical protein
LLDAGYLANCIGPNGNSLLCSDTAARQHHNFKLRTYGAPAVHHEPNAPRACCIVVLSLNANFGPLGCSPPVDYLDHNTKWQLQVVLNLLAELQLHFVCGKARLERRHAREWILIYDCHNI